MNDNVELIDKTISIHLSFFFLKIYLLLFHQYLQKDIALIYFTINIKMKMLFEQIYIEINCTTIIKLNYFIKQQKHWNNQFVFCIFFIGKTSYNQYSRHPL